MCTYALYGIHPTCVCLHGEYECIKTKSDKNKDKYNFVCVCTFIYL